jgi:hypothetical protein
MTLLHCPSLAPLVGWPIPSPSPALEQSYGCAEIARIKRAGLCSLLSISPTALSLCLWGKHYLNILEPENLTGVQGHVLQC